MKVKIFEMLCISLLFSGFLDSVFSKIVDKGDVHHTEAAVFQVFKYSCRRFESEVKPVGIKGLISERKRSVIFVKTVLGITGQRMACVRHLSSYLVSSAGMEQAFYKAETFGFL